MRGFHEPGELGRRNQGNVARPSLSNDDSILLIDHLIEHGGQVRAKAGMRRFTRHRILDFTIRDSCTLRASQNRTSTTM